VFGTEPVSKTIYFIPYLWAEGKRDSKGPHGSGAFCRAGLPRPTGVSRRAARYTHGAKKRRDTYTTGIPPYNPDGCKEIVSQGREFGLRWKNHVGSG